MTIQIAALMGDAKKILMSFRLMISAGLRLSSMSGPRIIPGIRHAMGKPPGARTSGPARRVIGLQLPRTGIQANRAGQDLTGKARLFHLQSSIQD